MKYLRKIYLMTSFFEGFIQFPVDTVLFYYMRNEVDIDLESAKALVHVQLCVYYYSISVLPSVLPRKSPPFLINFISSFLILLSLAALAIMEYFFDPPVDISLFDDTVSKPIVRYLPREEFAHRTSVLGKPEKYSKLTLALLFSLFCGAKTLTTRHLIVDQFSLPAEHEAYNKFRVLRSTILGFGKILGLVISLYYSKQGPHFDFRKFFLALIVASSIDCLICATGFLIRESRTIHRIPNGLLKFFKLQRRVIHDRFFSRQVQEAQLNEQQEAQEEWKALVKVLPLFIPAVFIIAFRDQRYTQYLNQLEMLDPDIRYEDWLPTLFIFVMYPIIKIIGTIMIDGLLMPYMRRKGRPITAIARSTSGFVFVAISLAAAAILQCHVEKTKTSAVNAEESSILIYNTCECPAMISIQGIDGEVVCPPLFTKEISIPRFRTWSIMAVRVECGDMDKYSTEANVQFQGPEVKEYLILKANPRSISLEPITTKRFDETFNIYTMLRIIVVPFHANNGTFHFTDVAIENMQGTTQEFNENDMQYPFFYKDEYLKPGRYFIDVGRVTLLDINITYGASLTCLVKTREEYRMPTTNLYTLMPANSISIYYQIPQIFILSLSDIMLESPTFLYASNAVPKRWWNLVNDLWLSCGGTGNLITAIAMFLNAINRLVMVFLIGFVLCWLSIAIFIQLSVSMYTVNYEFLLEEDRKKITKL